MSIIRRKVRKGRCVTYLRVKCWYSSGDPMESYKIFASSHGGTIRWFTGFRWLSVLKWLRTVSNCGAKSAFCRLFRFETAHSA